MSSDLPADGCTPSHPRNVSSLRLLALLAAVALATWSLARVAVAQTARISSSELLPTGSHRIGDRLRVRVRLTARAGITPEVASVGDPPDDVVWGTATLSQHEDAVGGIARSEVRTSELQSQAFLVCRLLLE